MTTTRPVNNDQTTKHPLHTPCVTDCGRVAQYILRASDGAELAVCRDCMVTVLRADPKATLIGVPLPVEGFALESIDDNPVHARLLFNGECIGSITMKHARVRADGQQTFEAVVHGRNVEDDDHRYVFTSSIASGGAVTEQAPPPPFTVGQQVLVCVDTDDKQYEFGIVGDFHTTARGVQYLINFGEDRPWLGVYADHLTRVGTCPNCASTDTSVTNWRMVCGGCGMEVVR